MNDLKDRIALELANGHLEWVDVEEEYYRTPRELAAWFLDALG